MNKTVFVIMASYLGQYPGCSQNREFKFCRAVDSFLSNKYEPKKLIIVADGCDITERLYNEKYHDNPEIVFLRVEKQVPFGGGVRNKGLEYAKAHGDPSDIVCYLDTDDRFGERHIEKITPYFGDSDFVIYDTHRYSPQGWYISKVALMACHIGTSSFAHKLSLEASWEDGYGHDWKMMDSLSRRYKYVEIPMPEYYIHHTPNSDC